MTWAIVTGMAIGAVVGGGSAALQKKDILQGALMGGVTGAATAGIGSLLAPAASTAAEAAVPSILSETTSPIASNFATNAPLNSLSSTGAPIDALGQTAGDGMRLANMGSNLSGMGGGQGIAYSGSPNMAGMNGTGITGVSPVATSGGSYLSNTGSPASPSAFDSVKNFLSENKGTIGLAGLAGSMAPAANQQNAGQQDTTYQPYTYSANLNPSYTGAGTSYFDQGYKKLPTYTAANGGIMSLAEGGDASVDSAPVKQPPSIADYRAIANNATAAARNIAIPPMQANNIAIPPMQANNIAIPNMQSQFVDPQQQFPTSNYSTLPNTVATPNMQASYIAPQQQYTRPIQQVPQAVTDYNNTLAQRAQQEYVNSPQLGAFSSHFNDPVPLPPNSDTTNMLFQKYLGRDADPTGYAANKNATPEQITYGILTSPEYIKSHPDAPTPVAPADTGPASYTYNPATRGYMTSFAPAAPAAPAAPNAANSPAGIAALNQQNQQRAGWNADQGGGGGEANGGLMRSYAMGGGIGANYSGFDDHNNTVNGAAQFNQGPQYPMQQPQNFNNGGGIYNLGSYSDGGRLLKGPGDGVSDDIPAQIGQRQPARLADGEFVVPARIVSELGNGSTDAGARQLYSMMDRVQANRKKSIGKGKVAVNSKSNKYLPV